MEERYRCPFCQKKAAWVSSTYPLVVVHNCSGPLIEVGVLTVTWETDRNGLYLKKKEFHPHSNKSTGKIFVEPVSSVDDLKRCFNDLELDTVAYFTGQSHYKNFPFWDKLWEYRPYKILNIQKKLIYLVLLDHEYKFRTNATACMGSAGCKPTLEQAKQIIQEFRNQKIKVEDEALALRYITKPFD